MSPPKFSLKLLLNFRIKVATYILRIQCDLAIDSMHHVGVLQQLTLTLILTVTEEINIK